VKINSVTPNTKSNERYQKFMPQKGISTSISFGKVLVTFLGRTWSTWSAKRKKIEGQSKLERNYMI